MFFILKDNYYVTFIASFEVFFLFLEKFFLSVINESWMFANLITVKETPLD